MPPKQPCPRILESAPPQEGMNSTNYTAYEEKVNSVFPMSAIPSLEYDGF